MAGRTDGVDTRIGLDTKKALKNVRDLNKEVNSLGKSINTAFQTTAIIGWGKAIMSVTQQMINASKAQSEYIENFNLLEVSYKNNTGSAEKLMDTLKNFYGLNPSGLTKQLATYKQMTSAMQLGEKASSLLSENLLKMQEDVASLYNLDFERVGSKFQSALAGQTRAVRDLGVDITQTSLQQELYNRGIDKNITDMNRASKTVLIYLAMERQLSNAQGDAARTINSVANQTKIFREQISIASRQIGALFIPVLKTVLPILNGILMTLNAIGEFILGLLGIGAKDLASEFGISTISTDFDDLGASLDDAGKKADKLYGKLRPFDKLNVITTPTDKKDNSSKFGGGIDKDLLGSLKTYNEELEKAKNKAKEIRDAILGWLGFTVDENGQIKDFHWTLGSIAGILAVSGIVYKGIKGIAGLISNIKKSSDKVFGNTKDLTKVSKGLLSPLKEMNFYYKELRQEGNGIIRSAETAREVWIKSASTMDKIKLAFIGLAEVVAGGLISSMSFKSINEEGLNFYNTLGLIAGAILMVKGAIEVTTAVVGLFNAKLAANPITAVIGALIGVGGLIASLVLTQNELQNSEKEVDEYTKKLKEVQEEAEKMYIKTEAQISIAKDYQKELSNLVDANGNVKGSYDDVDKALAGLNDTLDLNIERKGDHLYVNGKLIKTQQDLNNTINETINKLKEETINEMAKKKIEPVYEKRATLLTKEKNLIDELKKSAENYNLQEEEGYNNFITDNAGKIDELNKLQGELMTNQDQLDNYYNAISQAEKGNFDAALSLLNSQASATEESIVGTINSLDLKLKDGWETDVDVKVKVEIDKKWNKFKSEYDEVHKSGLLGSMVLGEFGPRVYADGGFVDEGEMFIAREAGPEMVGKIGNKTAVANNDQIVSGISIGVARALKGFNTNSNVVIKADADTEGLLNFINFKQQQMNRQYGF